jgi:hypothetical protein
MLVGVVENGQFHNQPWVNLLHPSPPCKLIVGPNLVLDIRPKSMLVGVDAGGGRQT